MRPETVKDPTPSKVMRMSRRQRENLVRVRRKVQRIREVNRRLDLAKAKTGSDWKTAQVLHVSPQRLCDIRKGRRPMTTECAVRLGKVLGEHLFTTLARTLADRAYSQSSRRFWLNVGVGVWPFVVDSYYDWAVNPKRKKYPLGGY